MVHKPKHKVHSFRGLLGDGGQDEIHLERSNVNLAYRIVKFELMGFNVGANSQESTVKIYRETQTSITGTIDFTETDLLAAGIYHDNVASYYPTTLITIFDNTLFSRNIYITQYDINSPGSGESCNYYIELEEVPVTASTLMQLKLGVARKLSLTQ